MNFVQNPPCDPDSTRAPRLGTLGLLGFRVWGWGLGFRVWGLGFRVYGLGFRRLGLGFGAESNQDPKHEP